MKSKRVTEDQTLGMVYDFCLGVSPERTSERIGLSAKTVRKYSNQIRVRVLKLFFYDSILNISKDVWNDVSYCVSECPNLIEKEINKDNYGLKELVSSKHKNKEVHLYLKTRIAKCSKCPLVESFELTDVLKANIEELRRSRYQQGADNFSNTFWEAVFLQWMRLPLQSGNRSPAHIANLVLQDMNKNPI